MRSMDGQFATKSAMHSLPDFVDASTGGITMKDSWHMVDSVSYHQMPKHDMCIFMAISDTF